MGAIATYSCKPGFVLEGEDTRVCNRSGNWTGSVPECKSMYCSVYTFYIYTLQQILRHYCMYSSVLSMASPIFQ